MWFFIMSMSWTEAKENSDITFVDEKNVLTGFNCANPTNIRIHSYGQELPCQETWTNNKKQNRSEVHFQILQRYRKIETNGKKCVVYKSSKHAFCGVYSHQTLVASLDVKHHHYSSLILIKLLRTSVVIVPLSSPSV